MTNQREGDEKMNMKIFAVMIIKEIQISSEYRQNNLSSGF